MCVKKKKSKTKQKLQNVEHKTCFFLSSSDIFVSSTFHLIKALYKVYCLISIDHSDHFYGGTLWVECSCEKSWRNTLKH